MPSSLFSQLPQQAPAQMPAPSSPLQLMQRFQQFKQQFAGQNPRDLLNQMVQSGRVSQEQVNQAMQMAQQFFPK